MKRISIAAAACVTIAVLLAFAANHRALEQDVHALSATSPATTFSPASTEAGHQGFLHGRVTTDDGATHLGRLRFGGDEEASWGDYFNGVKRGNPWTAHLPGERLTKTRSPLRIFGFEIPLGEDQIDFGRPFMARFGDIARIEGRGRHVVQVTLKSGTVFDVARMAANDFDDGVRVWDEKRGVVNLASWAGGIPPPARVRIRSIDLLPGAVGGAADGRLHGTARTRHGDFSGFVQWDRQACVGADELHGRTADGQRRLRFDTIRSIARRSPDNALVTLRDGREIVLSGTRDGDFSRGIYVDDQRYGRVLVSWDAFERIDFSAGGSGPAYNDFPPGRSLRGSVTTRAGRRLTGRLVYDLDESETTETLDAPSDGVDYTIPFGLLASIAPDSGDESGDARDGDAS